MPQEERFRLSLGQKDCIYLDIKERMTFLSIIQAMREIHEQRIEQYSMTRLIKTAYEKRLREDITEIKIRRLIPYMVLARPRLIHIRQKGNFRLVSPTAHTIQNIF